jgi:hypothetical protein
VDNTYTIPLRSLDDIQTLTIAGGYLAKEVHDALCQGRQPEVLGYSLYLRDDDFNAIPAFVTFTCSDKLIDAWKARNSAQCSEPEDAKRTNCSTDPQHATAGLSANPPMGTKSWGCYLYSSCALSTGAVGNRTRPSFPDYGDIEAQRED